MFAPIFVIIILLFCATTKTRAQNIPFVPPVYNFDPKYTENAGNQNWAIAQGADGVIYIGNNNGMQSFDGTNRTLHTLPNKLSVKSIFVDTQAASEKIYVGSFEDFGYFAADETNQLVYHSIAEKLENYTFQNDEIWSIHKQGNKIYFQSFSSYFVFDTISQSVQAMKPSPAPLFFYQVNGEMFAQLINNGFYLMRDNKFEQLLQREQLGGSIVAGVLPYDDEKYILVSSQNGLYIFDPKTKEAVRRKTDIDDQLDAAIVNRTLLLSDSLIVIGTLNNGVYAITADGQLKWHLNRQNGMMNNTVLGLFADNENNVWVALDNGVAYIRLNAGLSLFEPIDTQLGLVEDILFASQNMYMATNQGIYKYMPERQSVDLMPQFEVQSWFIRQFDNQIITGNNKGTSFIENDQNIPLPTATGGMDIKRANIYDNDVLIESTYTSLSIYRKNNVGQWQYNNRVIGFSDLINRIEIDHTGNVWAGHMYKGVYKLRLNATLDSVLQKTYYSHLHTDNEQAHIKVMKLRGRMVFSDSKRLYTYDDIAQRIVPYSQLNNDLPGMERASRIVTVNDTLFWFVLNNEYALVKFADNKYQVSERIPFSILNNPPNANRGNVYVADDGASYLSLNGGIAKFIAGNSLSTTHIDKLRIHTVKTYDRKSGDYRLIKPLSHEAIQYSNNNISFQFQFTDFSRKAFRVECFLENYDSRWAPTDNNLLMTYTNLPAANYTLRARVVSDTGYQLSATSYTFRIKNPWYKNPWSIAAYIVAITLLLYLAIKQYTQRLIRRRNAIFAQQEKDRIAQIDRQDKLIATLKNERLEADLTYKSKELASATMNIINQKEFLNSLKAEMQALILSGKINKTEGNKLLATICENLSEDDDWAVFQENFDLIHQGFFRKLQEKYPSLTPYDLKLCTLLRLNYSSKEIAKMLNLTIRGVEAARYRLRKKLQLSEDENLTTFIIEFR